MMAVNDLIRNLFKGCQMENQATQLMVIMRKISTEYYHGGISDDELKALLGNLCRTITAQLAGCGKEYAIDQCVADFQSALGKSVSDDVYQEFLKDLKKKKGKPSQNNNSIF